MKYFIDTEFLEGPQKGWFGKTTKPTIDLISVGIVCEDGREYYAISKDFNLKEAWNRCDVTRAGLTNLGMTPAYEKVGFGIAFLVGLVASVSTCLAVTGGIIICYTESIVDKTNGWNTQLRFHMGRIIAFTLGGFVLGMIGQTFSTSVYFNGILSIFVGFVLAYL